MFKPSFIVRSFISLATLICVIIGVFVPGQQTTAAVGINRQVNYQGKLLTSASVPVTDGTYSIKFSLYDAASGGTRVWTAAGTTGVPVAVSVTVTSGLFTVQLGDVSAGQNPLDIDWNTDSLYLGVTIAADSEMTPRKRLTAVPYAFNSETLQGQYASSSVASTGGNLFALHQLSSDAAAADRTALMVYTSGTSNLYDYLIKANAGADVFTISRQGHVTTTGNLATYGNLMVGDSAADLVVVSSRFGSSLVPTSTNVYDLGSGANSWANVYASGTLYAGTDVKVNGTSVCLSNGANCGSLLSSTSTLADVTSKGSWATTTVQLYGGFLAASSTLTSTFTVAGDTSLQGVTMTSATATNVTTTNLAVLSIVSTTNIVVGLGSSALPSISFSGDPNTGIYSGGADDIRIGTNGGLNANFTSTAISFWTGGAVTIGNSPTLTSNINNNLSLGTAALSLANIYASGTMYAGGIIAGHVAPYFNNTYDLGTATTSWRDVYASGTIYAADFKVGSSSVCLSTGVNCPASSSDWVYSAPSDFLRTNTSTTDIVLGSLATSTGAGAYFDLNGGQNGTSTFYFGHATNANIVLGGTSTTIDYMNAMFKVDGNDLFVSGNIGSASSVYTNGAFVAGQGSTWYGDGFTNKTNGKYDIQVGGVSIISVNGNSVSTTGDIVPTANSTYILGASAKQWGRVWTADMVLNNTVAFSAAGLTGASTTRSLNVGWVNNTDQSLAVKEVILAGSGDAVLGGAKLSLIQSTTGTLKITNGSTDGGRGNLEVGSVTTTGNIYGASNNAYDIGSGVYSWKDVYASGTAYFGTDARVGGVSVCLANGTNCVSQTMTTPTLADVTSKGSSATTTIQLYGGFLAASSTVTSTFTVAGDTSLQGATMTNATATNVTTTNLAASLVSSSQYIAGPGSASAPSFTFSGDTDSGFYSFADGAIGITLNGAPASIIHSTAGTIFFNSIAAGNDNVYNLGAANKSWANVYASGTVYGGGVISSGHVSPFYNNLYDLGTPSSSWRNIYASGTVYAADFKVGSSSVCLANGTNCPASSGGDWVYNAPADFLRTNTSTTDIVLGSSATSTGAGAYFDLSGTQNGTSTFYFGHATNANIVLGGTSTTVGFMNPMFKVDGNDLFVSGNIGSASSVYTNGAFIAGSGSTLYGDGFINKTNGSLVVTSSANVIINPSGYVGIGTSTPSEKLTISGNIKNIIDSSTVFRTASNAYRYAWDGSVAEIFSMSGNYLYLPDSGYNDGRLNIVDVSDPTSPSTTASFVNYSGMAGGTAYSVVASGRYAYGVNFCGDIGGNCFVVTDVSNHASPFTLSKLALADAYYQIFVDGSRAYIAGTTKLAVLDISDPRNPVVLSTTVLASNALDLAVSGNYLYVVRGTSANKDFSIYDVTTGTALTLVANVAAQGAIGAGGARSIAIEDGYAYVVNQASSSLSIVDITDPTSPRTRSTFRFSTTANAYSVRMHGRYAYVMAFNSSTFEVIDVSSSTSPGLTTTIPATNPYWFEIQGKYLYYVDNVPNLYVLELPGIETAALSANSAEVGSLQVKGRAVFGDSITVNNGINVGQGGILTNGTIGVSGSGTSTILSGLTIGTSTYNNGLNSLFAMNGNDLFVAGNIGSASSVYTNGAFIAGSGSTLYGDGFLNKTNGKYDIQIGGTTIFSINGNSVTTTGDFFPSVASTYSLGSVSVPWLNIAANNVTATANLYTPRGTITDLNTTNVTGTNAFFTNLTVGSYTVTTTVPTILRHIRNTQRISTNSTNGHMAISGRYAYLPSNNLFAVVDIDSPSYATTVGSLAGGVISAAVQGRYAYITGGAGFGIKIYDISQPTLPVSMGSAGSAIGDDGIAISGKYAFTAAATRIRVYDIASSTNPELVRDYTSSTFGSLKGVAVQGSYAYFTGSTRFYTVDISNPLLATSVGMITDSSNLTFSRYLAVRGRYAYVPANSRFNVIDISSATAPRIVASVTDATFLANAQQVALAGDVAYVSDSSSDSIVLFDISDATNPTRIGRITDHTDLDQVTGLSIVGNKAYASVGSAASSTGLTILSLTGIEADTMNVGAVNAGSLFVGESVDIGGQLSVRGGASIDGGGLSVSGALAVQGGTTSTINGTLMLNDGLRVDRGAIDVIPSNPIREFTVSSTAAWFHNDMTIRDTFLFAMDSSQNGVHVYDTTKVAGFQRLSTITDATRLAGATGGVMVGQYLYTLAPSNAAGNDRLTIIDTSNPLSLTVATSVQIANAPTKIAVQGKFAYIIHQIAAGPNITIYDISSTTRPVLVRSISDSSKYDAGINSIAIQGNRLYTQGTSQFTITDISDPYTATATVRTTAVTSAGEMSLYPRGRYVFAAANGFLFAIDVSSTSVTPQVTTCNSSFVTKIIGAGKYVYGWYTGSGLFRVFDVSNPPSSCTLVSSGPVPTTLSAPEGFLLRGNQLYISDNNRIYMVNLNGTDIPTANIGNLYGGSATFSDTVTVDGDVYTQGGLDIGKDILTNGALAVRGAATSSIYSTLTVGTSVSSTKFIAGMGSVTVPSYTFSDDEDTGMYEFATGSIAFALNGSPGLIIHPTAGTVFFNTISPGNDNVYDNGAANKSWRNVYASGTAYFGTDVKVNGQSVCLASGANCTSPWVYTTTGDYLRTASATTDVLLGSTASSTGAGAYFDLSGTQNGTSTFYFGNATNANIVLGGTSTTVAHMNPMFKVDGNDLYVGGSIGSASSVYTNGAFVAGSGSTLYGDGFINKTNGSLTVMSAGDVTINPLGSSSVFTTLTNGYAITVNGSQYYQFVVQGNYGYFTDPGYSAGGLSIVDMTNPSSPSTTAYYSGFNGGAGGWSYDVVVSGQYVFSVHQTGGVGTFGVTDVSNHSAPIRIATTTLPEVANRIVLDGHIAYVGGASRVVAIDVSNPTRPTILSSITVGAQIRELVISGNYLYVTFPTTANKDFAIYDVTNPAVPVQKSMVAAQGSTAGAGNAYGFDVRGGYAYVVNNGSSTLSIIDVSNPSSPRTRSNLAFSTTANLFIGLVQGRYVYVQSYGSSTVDVIDVANPASPVRTASFTTNAVFDLQIQGKYLYYTSGESLYIHALPGIETAALYAHSAELGAVHVQGEAIMEDRLNVLGGLNVGLSGILTNGSLAVSGNSTSSFAASLLVGSSTYSGGLPSTFVMDGNDFLVGGMIGSASSIFTNGQLVIGDTTNPTYISKNAIRTSGAAGQFTIDPEGPANGNNIILGDASVAQTAATQDNIYMYARVATNILPRTDDDTSIGTSAYRWNAYFNHTTGTTFTATSTTFGTTLSATRLENNNAFMIVAPTGLIVSSTVVVPPYDAVYSLGQPSGSTLRWKGYFTSVSSTMQSTIAPSAASSSDETYAGLFIKQTPTRDSAIDQAAIIAYISTSTDQGQLTESNAPNLRLLDPTGGAALRAAGYFVNNYSQINAKDSHFAVFAVDNTSSTFSGGSMNGAAIGAIRKCASQPNIDVLALGTTVTTGGAFTRKFSVRCDGSVHNPTGAMTGGADYAEMFAASDASLTAGEVVAFDVGSTSSVKRAMATDRNIALGVISSNPSVLGNTGPEESYLNNPMYKPVGLLGQLSVKASNANGDIVVGDRLMAGDNGFAIKAKGVGIVLGTALESFTSSSGMIQAYIDPDWSADGILESGNNTTNVLAQGIADATTTAYDSYGFSFTGSVWDAASSTAITSSFTMMNDVISASSSLFTLRNTADASLLTISDVGDMSVTGDLTVGRRLFLGSKTTGAGSTSTYIFVDDTQAPTSTYVATNADGWSTLTTYDYAERFHSNDALEPGDLVAADATGKDRVRRVTSKHDVILGIVSTKPGFITGAYASNTYPIALAGRVPTRVSTANGPIVAGDQLSPSDVPGVAVKAVEAGPIVGIALESYDAPTDGKISVFVQPGWKGGSVVQTGETGSTIVYQPATAPGVSPRSGLAKIAAGATEVNVSFTSLNSYPLITVAPYGQATQGWWLTNVNDHGFTIVLGEAPTFDLVFSWKAEPSPEGATMSFSDGTSASYDVTSGQVSQLPSQPVDMTTTSTPPADTTTTTEPTP